MKFLVMFLLMIILLFFSMLSLALFNNYYFSCILLIVNFIFSFFIVNSKNNIRNFVNLQSFFLLGFFVFFLGRISALLLNPSLYNEIFCIDFIFNYCEGNSNINYLILVLNLILLSFSAPFLLYSKFKNVVINQDKILKNRLVILYLVTFVSSLLVINNVLSSVFLAVSQGYMALYANQVESYQTPYMLLINTIAIAGMAVLYSLKEKIKPIFFNVIFLLFLLSMLFLILTGSRAAFISALLLIIWHIYKNKSINFIRYFVLLLFSLLVIYSIDTIAALSGARPTESNGGFLKNMGDTLYNQGITLMVFNSSINIQDYPLLGYIKTLLPGIQVVFSHFDINERHEFDWSSYMTYHENRQAYNQGLGLGWSIFSDFYILSFGILPIFCLFIYLFGKFLIYVSNANNNFKMGLLFICILSCFSIVRASISPLIFTIIIYIFFCLYIGTLRIKKW